MMTEIIRELTAIKKTKKITNYQLLCMAKALRHKEIKRPYLEQPEKTKNLTLCTELINKIMNKKCKKKQKNSPKQLHIL